MNYNFVHQATFIDIDEKREPMVNDAQHKIWQFAPHDVLLSYTYQNKAQSSNKYLRDRIQAPIINMQLKY